MGIGMAFDSLVEAFEALNTRKLEDPEGLDSAEREEWKELRSRIEEVLFQQAQGPGADRREHIRVPVSLTVRYYSSSEFKDRYIPVLGEGGLFIPTDDPLPIGEFIDLDIILAQKEFTLNLRGKVVWVDQGEEPSKRGMGVQFVDLSYIQKSFLYQLVSDSIRARLLERRHYTRIDTRIPVEFLYPEGAYSLTTSDLSANGAFVATDHLVTNEELVKVLLEIPDHKQPVRVVARVIRAVEESLPGLPAGIGLEFDMTDKQGGESVLDYLVGQVDSTHNDGPGTNQRRYSRIKRRIPVQFSWSGVQGASFCRDISSGGIFIQVHEPPPVGSQVQVDIEHPLTHQHLQLCGRAVRVVNPDPSHPHQVPGVGVLFTDVDDGQNVRLREFLREFVLLESTSVPPESPADPISTTT